MLVFSWEGSRKGGTENVAWLPEEGIVMKRVYSNTFIHSLGATYVDKVHVCHHCFSHVYCRPARQSHDLVNVSSVGVYHILHRSTSYCTAVLNAVDVAGPKTTIRLKWVRQLCTLGRLPSRESTV